MRGKSDSSTVMLTFICAKQTRICATCSSVKGMRMPGPLVGGHKWDEDRRVVLRAELDAYYSKLYGLNRKQLRYILDPQGLSQREL